MARPSNILRSIPTKIYIPEDLKVKLDLHLYSAVEKRVPFGDYSKFMCKLLAEYFEKTPV